MKKFVLTVLVLFSFSLTCAYSEDDGEKVLYDMKMRSANENHQVLDQFSGGWKLSIVYFDPNSNEETSSVGFTNNTMVLGNKFMEMKTESNNNGNTLQTDLFIGYDNFKAKYFIFWLDNVNTYYNLSYGDYNKKEKKFIFKGEYTDENNKKLPYKIAITIDRENKYTYEFYTTYKNKEFKSSILMAIKQN